MDTERMYVDVPAELKRRVKAAAALRGLTMNEAVAEGMETWCLGITAHEGRCAHGGTGSTSAVALGGDGGAWHAEGGSAATGGRA